MVNFPADVPTLSDDDVVTLRAHHPGDVDRIIEFANDERSRRFIPLTESAIARWTSACRTRSEPMMCGCVRCSRPISTARTRRPSIRPGCCGWTGPPTAPCSRREWLSRERQVTVDRQRWAICAPDGDEFLGCVTVQNIDQRTRSGELGYWVHPDARGRGLAVAAVNAAAGYSFSPEGLALRRLSINVAEGNEPSIAVAQRTGFQQTGRDSLTEPLGDGRVVDRLRFDRLAPD